MPKYRIIKLIGQGAFAKVFMAQNESDQSKIAIKVFMKNKKTKDAFETEFAAYRYLFEHKDVAFPTHILECTGGEITRRHCRLFLSLGEQSFRDVIYQGKRMDVRSGMSYCKIILHSLRYLHSISVCHRDIKPDNIMICAAKIPKLCDFGLACIDTGERKYTFCGTPWYMAPELFNGKGYNGFAVDVWAFGVMVFEMFHRRLPFTAYNMSMLKTQIFRRQMGYMIPSLGPNVKFLILKPFLGEIKRPNAQLLYNRVFESPPPVSTKKDEMFHVKNQN